MKSHTKLVRVTTVPSSLQILLRRQLRFVNGYYDVLAVSSPGKELEEVAQDEGVRTSAVNMTRTITPWQDAKALWQLYRLFKREKPAIVHTHTPKAGLLGMIAGKMAKVPVRMHTVAGLPLMESTGMTKKLLELMERLTYTCATDVYPNSALLANFIKNRKYCGANKVKVLGNGSSNGIDTGYFKVTKEIKQAAEKLRAALQISKSDFVFVFVGRLVKDKGIEELVNAFLQMQKKYNHIKLLLVGTYEPQLDPLSNETTKAISNNEAIIYAGFQQDIRPYLAISHALAFPSYREGFPNVPMQAGCLDLPCIVTDINGCTEIIEHEKNGLIIPVKNAHALEGAMEKLLTDESLLNTLKSNARAMILARYDQQLLWNLLLKEYQQQLSSHAVVS
ncbi:glycosyltransferase family 4 protein [Ilyomonas limi]|uniref:Glycosyltransferase family 4 protein n=1 Tax=Ilyomonas limi TaxID=2575867 RepID=A0A4U3KRY5_9BACT|nr:glycosyltransferase family 4 protein [Ilyomonas limi]TKK65021.1 glycosyltransferase family 4 protein [Ilyomonas limi]